MRLSFLLSLVTVFVFVVSIRGEEAPAPVPAPVPAPAPAPTPTPAPAPAPAPAPVENPFISGEPFSVQNRVDELLILSLQRREKKPSVPCSDAVFIRRVFLDTLGILPTVSEVRTFLASTEPDKRAKLIETLLDRDEFVDYQTMRWSDLLRVKAEFPINLWPNGAACYFRWIHRSVAENRPYDQFTRELLLASGSNFRDGPSNFYRAASSREPSALAEAVAITFLGSSMEQWPGEKKEQFARFFSQVAFKETAQWKEEIVYWNPTEATDTMKTAFPDGKEVEIDFRQDPRELCLQWLLDPQNTLFHRCAADRVWKWLFGAALQPDPNVEPIHPELLDYLAAELIAAKYDLKQLYRLILNSGAYRQTSVCSDPDAPGLFAAYPVRRIEAEVLQDALTDLFDIPLNYISEVPEPFTYIPPRYRTILLPDPGISSSFLEMFGRASRDTGTDADRNNGITESQQMYLLNSTEINNRLHRIVNRQKNLGKFPDEAFDDIWLTLLARFPTEQERQYMHKQFEQYAAKKWHKTADLVWTLLNTTEFLCKH